MKCFQKINTSIILKVIAKFNKPLETQEKRRDRIFSNHLHSSAKPLNNSSKTLKDSSYGLNTSLPGGSKVRHKMLSALEESHFVEREFEKIELDLSEQTGKKYLTPNDFMEILK